MTDNKPAADVTKDWQATQAQKSAATRLRLFAALSWIVAIGGQIAGVVLLYQPQPQPLEARVPNLNGDASAMQPGSLDNWAWLTSIAWREEALMRRPPGLRCTPSGLA
jgi:hypothetical protein